MTAASSASGGSAEREAWPFLVASGVRLGVRIVVAPDFLRASGDVDVVFEAARTGPGIDNRGPALRTVQARSGETLTLCFRRTEVTLEEAGVTGSIEIVGTGPAEAEPMLLHDAYGRPITLIEGFVLRGEYQQVAVGEEQWRQVHAAVLPGYRRLLADEGQAAETVTPAPAPTAEPSGRILLGVSGRVVTQRPPEPPPAASQRVSPVAVLGACLGATVLIALLIALLIVLLRH